MPVIVHAKTEINFHKHYFFSIHLKFYNLSVSHITAGWAKPTQFFTFNDYADILNISANKL